LLSHCEKQFIMAEKPFLRGFFVLFSEIRGIKLAAVVASLFSSIPNRRFAGGLTT